ncbi:MAG: DUF4058 family protein, partial [Planctomycetes bacterium]|nr:DUF4058 family protein [Planctomycetota bacterium]
MKSPFPGMDPYLEDPAFWRDFHHRFINCLCETIADALPDDYEARLDEAINLVHPSEEDERQIYPDVTVTRKRRSDRLASRARSASTLVLEPVTVRHEYLDEYRQGRIEIRKRPDRRLVTEIEVLSPTNKVGAGFEEYRGKRREILHRKVHLVELDLLMGGIRPHHADPLPPGEYYVYTSRIEKRPDCEVLAWGVRDRLPTIPIPLLAPDADIHTDLGAVIAVTYQRGRYSRSLAYGKRPVAPLSAKDVKWAVKLSAK